MGVREHVKGKNYLIKDENLWKQLLQTFVIVSYNEYENIIKKIEKDDKFQI